MLYRTYRPQDFDQVIGQEHVVQTLKGALTSGRIGHAYLFAGPRGTGKTTLARIFAKAVNCTNYYHSQSSKAVPCNRCDFCVAINENKSLDLIEIDAASNRGIDEIRNVKESAGVAATGGRHKVFLVDEVHMLTKDAFNALLKILEEPPSHVVFILATTEPHKILVTVLSRVQRFDFKKILPIQIGEKLKHIVKSEKVAVEPAALQAIALAADGAFRDAEVSLTKVLANAGHRDKITAADVYEILGLTPATYYPELLGLLINKNRAEAIGFIHKIYNTGIDLDNFAKEFLEYLRRVMIQKINPALLVSIGQDSPEFSQLGQQLDHPRLIAMMNVFTRARQEMKISSITALPLELAIMELCI